MLLFVTVYPPGNHTMVILKAPAEVHPGPLQVKSGSHRLPPGSRTGGGGAGTLRAVAQKFSPFRWRIPTGAPPSPCRTVYRLDTWYISRRGRVTLKLELKVTRGPG